RVVDLPLTPLWVWVLLQPGASPRAYLFTAREKKTRLHSGAAYTVISTSFLAFNPPPSGT
ncbi:MAG: hypothetical protein RLN69_11215, partial [Woeseiaceae bacterium]